jgi:hypothetical protein
MVTIVREGGRTNIGQLANTGGEKTPKTALKAA